MNIEFHSLPLHSVDCDVLIMMLSEDEMAELPDKMRDRVNQAVAAGDFRGRSGESALFYVDGGLGARKLMLYGLGKPGKLNVRRLWRAGALAARAARKTGAKRLAITPPQVPTLSAGRVARAIVEGASHGLFRFRSFKTSTDSQSNVDTLILVGEADLAADVSHARIVAEAVSLTRGINWLPGNHLTATRLAEIATEVCQEVGVEIEVYDKQGCRDLGLHLLLAVNQGSVEEPRFIVMRYKGNGGNGPWLGLVGKGVTFDSGGISLKPWDGMWDMKYDMSGSGAVIGAMRAIAQLKVPCDVLAIISATDNMPDGGCFKPGDVLTGLSGKSVEVRSTDAEGRLVLADGLAYAVQQGCKKLITISTLTGSAHLAIGPIRYAIVSNNAEWEETVFQASEESGEAGWKFPIDEEYKDYFYSPIADMSNSALARAAGTVIGGMFLLEHVSGTPCVHMDIAAQAFKGPEEQSQDPGATGVGVRTLVQAAIRFAKERV